MFQFKSQSRRAVAATLRVVSLNVFFGQVVCALAMPAAASQGHMHPHPAGTATHHHDSEAARKHGHEPAPATEHHQHDAPAPDAHQHGPKGDCCQDDAAAVRASLAHPPKAGIGKLAFMPVALPPAPLVLVVRSQQWDRTRPVLLVARRQPQPQIPDIRIFIQSLTV